MGQGHHERPGAAQAVEFRIEQEASRAEVHLGFGAGLHLEPHGGPHGGRLQPTQEPLHRRVAPGEPVLLDQELVDRLPFHALLVPGADLRAEGGHGRLRPRRGLPLRRPEQGGQLPSVGQLAREQALVPRPAAVAGHGVPAQAKLPGDPPVPIACAEPAQHFTNVGHLAPPSSHGVSLRMRVGFRREIVDLAAQGKGADHRSAGWLHMADPDWLHMGDPGWLHIPDPGGSV